MNQEQGLKLLKESILTTGEFTPSQNFLSDRSVGIAINGKPIILLGWADDEESNHIADRLVSNSHFHRLVDYVFGSCESVEKITVHNSEVCKTISYPCITESEQGLVEDGQGSGTLVALILKDDRPDFGFGICVNNSIMQSFYPEAKPLSVQIELKSGCLN